MNPIELTFRNYFQPWGLYLPQQAVVPQKNGMLAGRNWSVVWVWKDQELLFYALNRFTNERLMHIDQQGYLKWQKVNGKYPPDDFSTGQPDVASYSEAAAYRQALGLEFELSDYPEDYDWHKSMLYKLEGQDYKQLDFLPCEIDNLYPSR